VNQKNRKEDWGEGKGKGGKKRPAIPHISTLAVARKEGGEGEGGAQRGGKREKRKRKEKAHRHVASSSISSRLFNVRIPQKTGGPLKKKRKTSRGRKRRGKEKKRKYMEGRGDQLFSFALQAESKGRGGGRLRNCSKTGRRRREKKKRGGQQLRERALLSLCQGRLPGTKRKSKGEEGKKREGQTSVHRFFVDQEKGGFRALDRGRKRKKKGGL